MRILFEIDLSLSLSKYAPLELESVSISTDVRYAWTFFQLCSIACRTPAKTYEFLIRQSNMKVLLFQFSLGLISWNVDKMVDYWKRWMRISFRKNKSQINYNKKENQDPLTYWSISRNFLASLSPLPAFDYEWDNFLRYITNIIWWIKFSHALKDSETMFQCIHSCSCFCHDEKR